MKSRIALLLGAVIWVTSVAAHDDADTKPKYGGVVTVVKDVQYELVAKPDSITVFIEDHGKKVDTQGATAKLTLLVGGVKSEIALVPVGENGLQSKGAFNVSAGAKAVAAIALVGKPAVNVRFDIK